MLSRLRKTLNLSLAIAKAEFKLRNEGSYLGILWYLLNPLLSFILLYFIFSTRLGLGIPNYGAYLLVGIIIFNFFRQSTVNATKIIVENDLILRSINFPKESLVLGVVFKNILSHIFEIILLIAVFIIFKVSLINLIFYPIILIFFFMFVFGCSLIFSCLTVYFIDLEHIWNFASRLIWLGTPIFYSIEGQTRLFYLNLINPMYYFIEITRDVLIYSKIPELWLVLGAVFYSFLFLIIGLFVFNQLKNKIGEML